MAHYKIVNGKMIEQPKIEQSEEKKITQKEMSNNIEEVKRIAENKIAEMQAKMQEEIEKRDAEIQRLTRQIEKLKKG